MIAFAFDEYQMDVSTRIANWIFEKNEFNEFLWKFETAPRTLFTDKLLMKLNIYTELARPYIIYINEIVSTWNPTNVHIGGQK